MNDEPLRRQLTTAGLLDPAKSPANSINDIDRTVRKLEDPQLARPFAEEVASEFRSRWHVIQKCFVNDPRRTVPHWR